MKKFITATFLTLALSTTALSADPEVLAKVNGKDITKKEIEAALANMTTEELAGKPVLEKLPLDFKKAFVEKYAEKTLIIEAARKAGLQNDADIKKKLAEAEEFLIQQKFLTDLVLKEKSEAKLKKIYEDKVKSKDGKEEAHAFHILVKTEDEAKKIREEIVKGGNFEKIAEQKSIDPGAKVSGGDLGYFTADQMVPDFSKAVFALKKNEVSQPIKTQFGWHIAKLVDKRKKKLPSFEESKPALESQLATEIIEAEVKKLKNSAKIEYFGDYAKKPEAPAVKKESPVSETKADKPAEDKPAEAKAVEPKAVQVKKEEPKAASPATSADKPAEAPAAKTEEKK